MAEPMNYFQPFLCDDEPIFVVSHVGKWREHTGAEALRRSSADFGQFMRSRIAAGPWIVPLVRLEVEQPWRRPPVVNPVPPDLFFNMELHVTERALNVIKPFCHLVPDRHPTDEIEFLPVELEDGGRLWLINPPVLEDVLDEDRSGLSRMGKYGEISSVNFPVLRRQALTPDHIFVAVRRYTLPILSGELVNALKRAGIRGLEWRPVEVID